MATAVEMLVAAKVLNMMTVGAELPAAANKPIAVAGMSWIDEVLMASNIHMSSLATEGVLFNDSSSSMAFIPKGVAALLSPRMFAERLRAMAPSAG